MERIDSNDTSAPRRPNWHRILMSVLVGIAVVQWTVGPLMGVLRPEATEAQTYFVVKGVTLGWVVAVIVPTVGWEAIGFRRPVRPTSALYGIPMLLLGGMALAGGVASSMTLTAFLTMCAWVMIGILIEEIVFRGVMWEAVASRGPVFTAITTSVGFGMIHLLGIGSPIPTSIVLAQACFAAGVGMVLAAARVAAGTIWTATALHWVFNMMSFAASGGVAATLRPGIELQLVGAGLVLALIGFGLVKLASRFGRFTTLPHEDPLRHEPRDHLGQVHHLAHPEVHGDARE